MYQDLAIVAIFVFLYSAIAGRVERSVLTGPIVATGLGLALGPMGLGWLDLQVGQEVLRTLAELTLALVLFTDAANAKLSVLRRTYRLPRRLLLVGLPLTIALGLGVAALLFSGLGFFEIAVLATMLAPTDAALGAAVVSNPVVPAPVREGLIVINAGLPGGSTLATVVVCTVILSILLHGLTANPLAEAFGRWVGRRGLGGG